MSKKGSTLETVRMADVKREDVRWLWKGRIPFAKVTMLDGDPGLGKSTIGMAITTHVTTGFGLPGEKPTEPLCVLLLLAEDGLADTVRPRLDKLGANLKLVIASTGNIVLDEAGCESLQAVLESQDDPRFGLVIIDPLFGFTGKADMIKSGDMRPVMNRLVKVAAKTGVAILCIRHLSKDQQKSVLYRGGGSIDISAVARSVLIVGADPDDRSRRALFQIKNNLSPEAEAIAYTFDNGVFAWTGETLLTVSQTFAPQKPKDKGGSSFGKDFDRS
jgi:RecA-family ATPase